MHLYLFPEILLVKKIVFVHHIKIINKVSNKYSQTVTLIRGKGRLIQYVNKDDNIHSSEALLPFIA